MEVHQDRTERAMNRVASCTERLAKMEKLNAENSVVALLTRAKAVAVADAEDILGRNASD